MSLNVKCDFSKKNTCGENCNRYNKPYWFWPMWWLAVLFIVSLFTTLVKIFGV